MGRYTNRLIYVGLVFLFIACSKTPYMPYHSTADIPSEINQTETEMRLINPDNVTASAFAVISAVDNDTLPYVLIAPEKDPSNNAQNIWNYDLGYSTSIPAKDLNDLISALEKIEKNWGSISPKNDGFFYEYTQTFQHQKKQISEDVVIRNPSLHLYFNLTEGGSVGSLIIGEGNSRFFHKFDEKNNIIALKILLTEAQNTLEDMTDYEF